MKRIDLRSVSEGAYLADPGRSAFTFDLRAIAAFRIGLAILILLDQGTRITDWQAFYSESAIFPVRLSLTYWEQGARSLYWFATDDVLLLVMEAARFVAAITLTLGIRSRLSIIVLFAVLSSVYVRNPYFNQGGDTLLVVLTFFGAFLPLGARMSLERLWHGPGDDRGAVCYRSPATVAFAIQVLLVWFMSGALKTGESWWNTGTAISMTLHMELYATEFARLWRHLDWLLRPLTLYVFVLEILGPLLAMLPFYWVRIAALAGLFALEVAIAANLEVGYFPYISIVSLIPLTPTRLIDWGLARWRRLRNPREPAALVFFYDAGCRFCMFACRLLRALAGLRSSSLEEAQGHPVARHRIEEQGAWSVAPAPADGRVESNRSELRSGWAAVRFVFESSPRAWVARFIPSGTRGDAAYAWIAGHRPAIARLGRACFGKGASRPPGRPWHAFVSAIIVLVVVSNLLAHPLSREHAGPVSRHVGSRVADPILRFVGVQQYWNMFAPMDYANDFWLVLPALSRGGETVNLLTGGPLEVSPPVDGPDYFLGNHRWRKILVGMRTRRYIDHVLPYFCAHGDWQAIDLWEVNRPIPGIASQSMLPYGARLYRRIECPGENHAEAIASFHYEVDSFMWPYARVWEEYRPWLNNAAEREPKDSSREVDYVTRPLFNIRGDRHPGNVNPDEAESP